MELKSNRDWKDSELKEAVLAYARMLKMETNGESYSKAAINRELTSTVLQSRNRSSIEFRMQNISFVLNYFNLPIIAGYKPARNVGTRVFERIKEILEQQNILDHTNYEATSDDTLLEVRSRRFDKIDLNIIPRGSEHPRNSQVSSTVYERNPLVRAWIFNNADGNCEACGKQATFKTLENKPYLEVHHVKPLAYGGSDKITNTIALCPDCHRRCHHSNDAQNFVESLYKRVQRLIRE